MSLCCVLHCNTHVLGLPFWINSILCGIWYGLVRLPVRWWPSDSFCRNMLLNLFGKYCSGLVFIVLEHLYCIICFHRIWQTVIELLTWIFNTTAYAVNFIWHRRLDEWGVRNRVVRVVDFELLARHQGSEFRTIMCILIFSMLHNFTVILVRLTLAFIILKFLAKCWSLYLNQNCRLTFSCNNMKYENQLSPELYFKDEPIKMFTVNFVDSLSILTI